AICPRRRWSSARFSGGILRRAVNRSSGAWRQPLAPGLPDRVAARHRDAAVEVGTGLGDHAHEVRDGDPRLVDLEDLNFPHRATGVDARAWITLVDACRDRDSRASDDTTVVVRGQ